MKLQFQNRLRLLSVAILAVLLAFCPALRADWGSVRANNRADRGVREHRDGDIEADRHYASYWSGSQVGMTMNALPPGFVQVSVGATGYYYYDGVYFQAIASLASGYAVVAPPLGVIVPQLPSGAEQVAGGNATYYYAGGAFYLQQSTGFQVMPAPLGVVVTTLPSDATPVAVKGVLYYQAANGYYLPAMMGGVTVYTTAQP
jgi:hypothetical protein